MLEQFEKMLSFSNDALTKSMLELDTNIAMHKNFELLQRIDKSLKQYAEKKTGLVYIGFMGHFSSGKSSTINSLLNLTKIDEREVDLHPSDKAISLIVHPDNEASFIKLSNYGQLPVKLMIVNNELLKNAVLIDTPGAGDTDPLLITELMQDYLPVCDLLLYFFSATNPIDKSDLPLFLAKQESLALIQTKYIFTRADEFRKDHDNEISVANFEVVRATKFVNTAIERIKQVVKNMNLTAGDFYLIDNRKKFNINHLLNYIIDFSSQTNIENQRKLHEYKLSFYRQTGLKVKSMFLSHIDSKIDILNKYVTEANNNISRYENRVKITNNRLSQTWRNYQNEIDKISKRNIDDLSKTDFKSYRKSVWDDESNLKLLLEIKNLEFLVKDAATKFGNNCAQKVLNENRPILQAIKNEIANLTFEKFPVLNFDLGNINVSNLEHIPVSIPESVKNKIEKIPETLKAAFLGYLNDAKTDSNSLSYRLKMNQPLDDLYKFIERGQDGLDSDIDQYFENVYLYRAGVFSEHVKAYISQLGISDELNHLEYEFNEAFKEHIKIEAKKLIFPNCDTFSRQFKINVKALKDKFENLHSGKESFEHMQIPNKLINFDNIIKKNGEELKAKISETLSRKLILNTKLILDQIQERISTSWQEYNLGIKHLKTQSVKKFILNISIAAGVVAIYWIVRFFKINDTFANNVIANIGSNVVIPIIALIYSFFTNKYSQELHKSKRRIKNELINSLNEFVDERLLNLDKELDERFFIAKHFSEMIDQQIADIHKQEFVKLLNEQYQKLINLHLNERNIRLNYTNEIALIAGNYRAYFEYDDNKLDITANEIRKEAIEPSFKFLEELDSRIKNAKNNIQMVAF